MHIYQFMQVYGLDVMIVLVFIAILALLVRRGKADLVRRIVYAMVVEAEQRLGSKTGQEKKAFVIARIYERLPLILRLVFTREDINRFIDDGVDRLKLALSTERFDLLGYSEEASTRLSQTHTDTEDPAISGVS